MIGVRSVFSGKILLFETHGNPEHLAGAVAMPFMIAPGTLSASMLIGFLQPHGMAAAAVGILPLDHALQMDP